MTTDEPVSTTATTSVTTNRVRTIRRGDEIVATGRRKTAVARVRLRPGKGEITVNGRDFEAYFPAVKDRALVAGALEQVGKRSVVNGRDFEAYFPAVKDRALVAGALEQVGKRSVVNVAITVDGGGPTGQAGACRLGIARALKVFDAELAEPLRQGGLLTRDGRMKERKKYGLRGARRGTQFSKR